MDFMYIRKDAKHHTDSEHRKQVNNVIKTIFCELYVEEMAVTQYLFLTEYTLFDNNNGSFDGY